MRPPMKTDEEILVLARELHARGELSVDRLGLKAEGGQRERLLRIVKQVRAEAVNRLTAPIPDHAAGAQELPGCIRDGLTRLAADIVKEMAVVRNAEMDRCRAAEAAAAMRFEAAIQASQNEIVLVNEDLTACEAEVAEVRGNLELLTGELAQARSAGSTAEELRRAEVERHSQERLALTQALARAQEECGSLRDEVSRQAEARRNAESDAAAAHATAYSAGAALERVRHDHVSLRAQCDGLLRQLSTAEAERDRALQDLHAVRKELSEAVGAEVPESAPRPGRNRGKTAST